MQPVMYVPIAQPSADGPNYFRILNMLALSVELYVVAYFIYTLGFESTLVVHAISMVWSLLYYIVPSVRTSTVYKFFAFAISAICVVVVLVSLYFFYIAPNTGEKFVWLVVIFYYFGPMGLVGLTLLL